MRASAMVLCALLPLQLAAASDATPPAAAPAAPAERRETAEERGGEPQLERRGADGKRELDGEERETEEELRMRKRILQSLEGYRAPSCAAAVEKIEGLLQRQNGHWHERTATGGLPTQLIGPLSQAGLWATQSEPVCANDPAQPRFNALRGTLQAIWAYPRTLSREQLDEHLKVLASPPPTAPSRK